RKVKEICRAQKNNIRKFHQEMTQSVCLALRRIVLYRQYGFCTIRRKCRTGSKRRRSWAIRDEEEEEDDLLRRFFGKVDVREWFVARLFLLYNFFVFIRKRAILITYMDVIYIYRFFAICGLKTICRLPLPCCVYSVMRSAFPIAEGQYHGYEEEDEDEL
ncbi:unnamed protein product, partial [Pocillopora meandrina]